MAQATDAQVQRYADERMRPRAEQLIRVLNAVIDDQASIADVFDRIVNGAPWSDARTDGPPSLAEGNDILEYNAFMVAFEAFMDSQPNWPVVRTMAVNGLQV
jgi:hypothetical protein